MASSRTLKVHEIFPKLKSYLPSLATSCENMASNSEQIMEKSRNFQIVYVARTNLCKHCTTAHVRGKLGISLRPHSPIAELSLPLEGGTDQLCLESAAPTGVKQVQRVSMWKAQSFKHSKTTSNILVFNVSPTSR